jgi:hypothetical protein
MILDIFLTKDDRKGSVGIVLNMFTDADAVMRQLRRKIYTYF